MAEINPTDTEVLLPPPPPTSEEMLIRPEPIENKANDIAQITAEAKQELEKIGDEIIQNTIEETSQDLEKKLDDLKDNTEEKLDEVTDKVEEKLDDLKEKIEDTKEILVEKKQEVVGEIIDKIEDLKDDVRETTDKKSFWAPTLGFHYFVCSCLGNSYKHEKLSEVDENAHSK